MNDDMVQWLADGLASLGTSTSPERTTALLEGLAGAPPLWRAFVARSAHLLDDAGAAGLLQRALDEPPGSAVQAAARSFLLESPPPWAYLAPQTPPPDRGQDARIRSFSAGTSWLTGADLAPDGRLLVSWTAGSSQGRLVAWDTHTGRLVRSYDTGYSPGEEPARWLRQGAALARVLCDGTVEARDASSDLILAAQELHAFGGPTLSVLRDGSTVALAGMLANGQSHSIRIFDTQSSRVSPPFGQQTAEFTWLEPHPDGRRLLSTSRDGALCLWDIESGSLLARHGEDAAPYPTQARQVRMLPGREDTAFVLDGDGRVSRWDLARGTITASVEARAERIALHPDGKQMVLATDNGKVEVWSLDPWVRRATLGRHHAAVTVVTISADGERAITAGNDGLVHVWDLARQPDVAIPDTRAWREPTESIVMTGDDRVICARSDRTLWSLDLASGSRTLVGEGGCGQGAGASSATRVAGISADRTTLEIRDLMSGVVHQLRVPEFSFDTAALSPGGERVAVLASGANRDTGPHAYGDYGEAPERLIAVLSVETGETLLAQTVSAYSAPQAVQWMPSGDALVLGGNSSIKLQPLDEAREIRSFEAQCISERTIAVSPDGARIATAETYDVIHLYASDTGKRAAQLKGHTSRIVALRFDPAQGARLLVSASHDSTVRVWDLDEARCVALWHAEGPLSAVAIRGGRVVYATLSGVVRALELIPGRGVAARGAGSAKVGPGGTASV